MSDIWDSIYQEDERHAIGGYSATFKELDKYLNGLWNSSEKLLNILGLKKGMKLIDIGCGSMGRVIIPAASQGIQTYGLDISKMALDKLKRRLEVFGLQCNLIHGDITEGIQYPQNYFDAVISMGTIMHIKEVQNALFHIARIVKEFGKVFITSFLNKYHPNNLQYEFVRWLLINMFGNTPRKIPVFYYSLKEVRNMFNIAGLRIVRIFSHRTIPLPLMEHTPYPKLLKFGVESQPLIGSSWSILAIKKPEI